MKIPLFNLSFRLIETDVKSMNSLQSGHSRRSSDTSQISVTSSNSFNEAAAAAAMAAGMSPADVNPEEDLWTMWGKLINEWEARVSKRQLPQIKAWFPDGYRSYVFGPSGMKDYGSAMLRCKI